MLGREITGPLSVTGQLGAARDGEAAARTAPENRSSGPGLSKQELEERATIRCQQNLTKRTREITHKQRREGMKVSITGISCPAENLENWLYSVGQALAPWRRQPDQHSPGCQHPPGAGDQRNRVMSSADGGQGSPPANAEAAMPEHQTGSGEGELRKEKWPSANLSLASK